MKVSTIIWLVGLTFFLIGCIWYAKKGNVIAFYNWGNSSFRAGEYSDAEDDYDYALYYKPGKKQQCSVRINKALAMVTPLTPESVTYDNLEDTIKILENAIDILVADDCAHRNDDDGHSVQAQILKNEIDEYIEWLRENVKPPEEGSTGDASADQKKQNEDEEDGQQKRLRELFEQIQQQGMQERNVDLNDSKVYFGDYEYYDGKAW